MAKQGSSSKKSRLTARFFSILLSIGIIVVIGYFFWRRTHTQIPNLHGWYATEAMAFGRIHNIDITFEFVYSIDMAPTLVVSQSIPPGSAITEDIELIIEISKGIEVR